MAEGAEERAAAGYLLSYTGSLHVRYVELHSRQCCLRVVRSASELAGVSVTLYSCMRRLSAVRCGRVVVLGRAGQSELLVCTNAALARGTPFVLSVPMAEPVSHVIHTCSRTWHTHLH